MIPSNQFWFGNRVIAISYDIDTINYITRLPDPISDDYANLWNNFIVGLQIYNGVDSLNEIFDYLYIFGGIGGFVTTKANAKINIISSSFPIVESGTAPTWANTGFTGGAGKFLKNGFIDSTHASALTLNDAMMFIYVNTDVGVGVAEIEAGNWVDDNSAKSSFVAARNGYAGHAQGQLNKTNGAAYSNGVAVTSAIGLTATERKNNNTLVWKNGVIFSESVAVPDGLVIHENHFLAILYGAYGSVIRNSTKELFAVGKGSAYNLDQTDLNWRFSRFLQGLPVILKQQLGTIFVDSFSRVSIGSDYTNTSGAFTANGTNLVATNTSGGQWDKVLFYSKSSYKCSFERTTQVVKTTVDSTSSKGIAIGYIGIYNTLEVGFRFDTGKIVFTKATGVTTLQTSTGTLTVSNGDALQITVRDHKGMFTCKVLNVTTGITLKDTYDFGLIYQQTIIRPSHYSPAIYACGGTQNITYWNFTSQVEKNADFALIGDSNFFRFYQKYKSASIPETLGVGKNWFLYGGPGLKTSDINWAEVAAANPKKALICLGTNDIYLGVSVATAVANIVAGVAILEAAGITVTICKIPRLNSVDTRPYSAALVTALGSRVGPDLFSIFPGAVSPDYQWLNGTYSSDYIHFNKAAVPIVVAEISPYIA